MFPFLLLPTELRLQVYEYLLTARSKYHHEDQFNPTILLDCSGHFSSASTRMPYAAILAACKLIHTEAMPILYSKNTFCADTFDAFNYLPPDALSNLRSVIFALSTYTPCVRQWISTLKTMPSGLRTLKIWFKSQKLSYFNKFHGIGTSIEFVRALGEVKGLSKLTIRGYYAVNWPDYLRRVMDCPVEAIAGRQRGRSASVLEEYQEGTEDLLP